MNKTNNKQQGLKKQTDTLLRNSTTGKPLMPLTAEQLTAISSFLAKELAKRQVAMKLEMIKPGLIEYLNSKGFHPKKPT